MKFRVKNSLFEKFSNPADTQFDTLRSRSRAPKHSQGHRDLYGHESTRPERKPRRGLGLHVQRSAQLSRVVAGEDHVFGAEVAEGGFVVAVDDGEGVEDVGGVYTGEAVKAGAQVAGYSNRSSSSQSCLLMEASALSASEL